MPIQQDHLVTVPALPAVPVLSLASIGRARAPLPALDEAPYVAPVTSGRIAIGMALRALDVGAGDTVLLPAYHSPSMVPPVLWRGATPVFYRIHPDTTADLDDIRARLDTSVKAIIVTHLFGFPQDLRALRALCDAHGIGLIEDCAHCYFGHHDNIAVGTSGDYAIGSSMKFFPVFEGGCLVSHRHPITAALQGAGPGFEAKAALATLEAAFAHGRLIPLKMALSLPLSLRSWLWQRIKRRNAAGASASAPASLAPSSSDSSYEFDAHWVDRRSSWFSRLVLRRAARGRIVAQRRNNYLALAQALSGVPGSKPLFPALPDGACPWVFPLLADRPQQLFASLKAAGVPMVRFGATLWPGVDASVCPVSHALGQQLFGLPCHQELTPAERERLIRAVTQALAVHGEVTQ